ncbi:hypothetical protein JKP88DRAFT_290104 [Tribonema minus]|uniref:CSN8/PSMD8/EIF3K domain-containing protein n=1 Tax=Tribonema minus TaxID=303371 RepID=A0A836CG25_9STRA|nr:hypothetical protein JKP88DRAFT_290104 [Tribonema minus]
MAARAPSEARLQSLLDSGQLKGALKMCEDLELESSVVAVPTEGAAKCRKVQMALYLLHGDLCNARHLWRRLHPTLKAADGETALLWEVGKAFWRRDTAAAYAAMNRQWSADVGGLVAALAEKTRGAQLRQIGRAYRAVPLARVCAMLSVDEAAARQSCGWPVEEPPQDNGGGGGGAMVRPSPLPRDGAAARALGADVEADLAALAKYMTFLEEKRAIGGAAHASA